MTLDDGDGDGDDDDDGGGDDAEKRDLRTRNAKLQQPIKFTPHTRVPDILWSRPDNTVQH